MYHSSRPPYEVCAIVCLIYTGTEWLSDLPKQTEGPRLSPGTGSKAHIPNHHVTLPFNLLYKRPILVWVPPIADPKTRI